MKKAILIGLIYTVSPLMAAQTSMKGMLFYPRMPTLHVGAPNVNGVTLDAADEKTAFVLTVPEETCIGAITFNSGSVGTPGVYDIRVETVDPITGVPTGTLWSTNASTAAFSVATSATFYTGVLVEGTTIPAATPFAVSWTRGASGVIALLNGSADYQASFAYSLSSTTSSGYVKTAGSPSNIMIRTCAGEYKYNPNVFPPVVNTTNFNVGTNPNYRGYEFTLPAPSVFGGFWTWIAIAAPVSLRLYDSDGATVLAEVNVSSNVLQAVGGSVQVFPSTATPTLLANTAYKVAYVPTTTTNISVYDFQVGAAAQMDVFDGGTNFYMTVSTGTLGTPTDNTSWTDTTTRRTLGGILLKSFDSGGGGGTVGHPFLQ